MLPINRQHKTNNSVQVWRQQTIQNVQASKCSNGFWLLTKDGKKCSGDQNAPLGLRIYKEWHLHVVLEEQKRTLLQITHWLVQGNLGKCRGLQVLQTVLCLTTGCGTAWMLRPNMYLLMDHYLRWIVRNSHNFQTANPAWPEIKVHGQLIWFKLAAK